MGPLLLVAPVRTALPPTVGKIGMGVLALPPKFDWEWPPTSRPFLMLYAHLLERGLCIAARCTLPELLTLAAIFGAWPARGDPVPED